MTPQFHELLLEIGIEMTEKPSKKKSRDFMFWHSQRDNLMPIKIRIELLKEALNLATDLKKKGLR